MSSRLGTSNDERDPCSIRRPGRQLGTAGAAPRALGDVAPNVADEHLGARSGPGQGSCRCEPMTRGIPAQAVEVHGEGLPRPCPRIPSDDPAAASANRVGSASARGRFVWRRSAGRSLEADPRSGVRLDPPARRRGCAHRATGTSTPRRTSRKRWDGADRRRSGGNASRSARRTGATGRRWHARCSSTR